MEGESNRQFTVRILSIFNDAWSDSVLYLVTQQRSHPKCASSLLRIAHLRMQQHARARRPKRCAVPRGRLRTAYFQSQRRRGSQGSFQQMYKVRAVLINRAMTWMRVVEQVASPMSTVLGCWRSMSTSAAISRPLTGRTNGHLQARSACGVRS